MNTIKSIILKKITIQAMLFFLTTQFFSSFSMDGEKPKSGKEITLEAKTHLNETMPTKESRIVKHFNPPSTIDDLNQRNEVVQKILKKTGPKPLSLGHAIDQVEQEILKAQKLADQFLATPNTSEAQAALKKVAQLERDYDKLINTRNALSNATKSSKIRAQARLGSSINTEPMIQKQSMTTSLEQEVLLDKPTSSKTILLRELRDKALEEFRIAKKTPSGVIPFAKKVELENSYLDLCKQLRAAETEDAKKFGSTKAENSVKASDKPKGSLSCTISDETFTEKLKKKKKRVSKSRKKKSKDPAKQLPSELGKSSLPQTSDKKAPKQPLSTTVPKSTPSNMLPFEPIKISQNNLNKHSKMQPLPPHTNSNSTNIFHRGDFNENELYDMLLEDPMQSKSDQKGPRKSAQIIQFPNRNISPQQSSPNTVIHLDDAQAKAHKKWLDAQRHSKNIPSSQTRLKWEAAETSTEKYLHYEKIKKANEHQQNVKSATTQKVTSQQSNPAPIKNPQTPAAQPKALKNPPATPMPPIKKSTTQKPSRTPGSGPWEPNATTPGKQGGTPPPPSSSSGPAFAAVTKYLAPKVALPITAVTQVACQTDLMKDSKICKAMQPTIPKNSKSPRRDAVIKGELAVGVETAIFIANPVAGLASLATTQAKPIRESIEQFNLTSRPASTTQDSFLEKTQSYLSGPGESQRTMDSIKAVSSLPFKIGEFFNDGKEKFIDDIAHDISARCDEQGITDENIRKFLNNLDAGATKARNAVGITDDNIDAVKSYVHHGMDAIQKSYQELLAIKGAGATPSTLSDPGHLFPGAAEKPAFIPLPARKPAQPQQQTAFIPIPSRKPQQPKTASYQELYQDALYREATNNHIAKLLEENNKKVAEVVKETIQEAQRDARRAHEKINAPLRNYLELRNNIDQSFTGLAYIAGIFRHDNTAHRLMTVGSATVQAMDSLSAFSSMGLACGLNPYVGMLSAAFSICSLFKKKQKDNSAQVILNAINNGIMHLSEQLYRYHKDVIELRKDVHELRKDLNTHQITMLESFFELHKSEQGITERLEDLQEYVEKNTDALYSGIGSLHNQAESNFRMISNEFKGLHTAKIQELIKIALSEIDSQDITAQDFNKIITKIYFKATERASIDSLTGGGIDPDSLYDLQTVLEGPRKQSSVFMHPAFSNLNLLSRHLEATEHNFTHKKLVNPLVWIQCAQALLHVINQKLQLDIYYPPTENMKDQDIKKLRALKEEGHKIISFIQQITQYRHVESVLADYQQATQELSQALIAEQQKYEQELTEKARAQHQAFFNDEQFQMQAAITKYDYKTSIEKLNELLKKLRTGNYKSLSWSAGTNTSCGEAELKEIRNTQITAESILNVPQKVKACQAIAQQLVSTARLESILNAAKIELSSDSFNPPDDCLTVLVYPANHSFPILMIPAEKFSLDPCYLQAETYGFKRIRHEYSLKKEPYETFQLITYLVDTTTQTKTKILETSQFCHFSRNRFEPYEFPAQYWYGGRYAQTDGLLLGITHGAYKDIAQPAGDYPAIKPRLAVRDTFVSKGQKYLPRDYKDTAEAKRRMLEEESAQKIIAQKSIQDFKKEKRLIFNQKIINHLTTRSTASPIYKAAQHVDVCFKLLDALLTLMYNDLIDSDDLKPHFAALKKQDICYPKNLTAMTRYTEQYSDPANQESDQLLYLPQYITQAAQSIVHGVQAILTSNTLPQFPRIMTTMNALDNLVNSYKKRKVLTGIPHTVKSYTPSDAPTNSQDSQHIDHALIPVLIESNRALAYDVVEIKEDLASLRSEVQQGLAALQNNMNMQFAALMSALSGNTPQQNSQPTQSYSSPIVSDRPLTRTKRVRRQESAECGYHALFNALQCFDSTISFEDFMQKNMDLEWLSEDELSALVQKYNNQNIKITLIGDIFMYRDGRNGLERSVLQDIVEAQEALQDTVNPYKRVYIVGTMNAQTENRMSHWIALEQTITHGKAMYTVMDSLPQVGVQREQVAILQDILHGKNDQHQEIALINDESEQIISEYISQLHLSTIFDAENRRYARHGDISPFYNCIVNKDVPTIIDDILDAAQKLAEATHGACFWSTEGYIQPDFLIHKALSNIQHCEQQEIICKENSDDNDVEIITVALTLKQKKKMAKFFQ